VITPSKNIASSANPTIHAANNIARPTFEGMSSAPGGALFVGPSIVGSSGDETIADRDLSQGPVYGLWLLFPEVVRPDLGRRRMPRP
jgi:hypothetical protein